MATDREIRKIIKDTESALKTDKFKLFKRIRKEAKLIILSKDYPIKDFISDIEDTFEDLTYEVIEKELDKEPSYNIVGQFMRNMEEYYFTEEEIGNIDPAETHMIISLFKIAIGEYYYLVVEYLSKRFGLDPTS